jgi:DNA mismatch endonuclease (patch repair protein)
MARDKRVTRQLRRQGWKVIRIWQHALKKSPEACLKRIRSVITLAGN